MKHFIIEDSQFDGADSDAPDRETILEALADVYPKLGDHEEVWATKGRYNLNFWRGLEDLSTIFCNAFVLLNPEDDRDSQTARYSYYYELREAA